jgi:DNA replication protein DnaC
MDQEKQPQTSSSITSNEGCEKCNYTGTINTFKWVEDDYYPIPREVASIELCSCFYERQFREYNASEAFSSEEKQFTFKNATLDNHNREHYTIAVDFVKDIKRHMKEGTWIYIFGDEVRAEKDSENGLNVSAFGTGKTHLMLCIANAMSLRQIPALYVTETKLFGDIKSTYARDSEESEEEVLRRYYNVPILMIDDIFTESYKDWAEGKLFSILDERQKNNKVTIMTSNYATGRIHKRLPINGRKIASRITGQSIMIEMIGPDRREMKARERREGLHGS